MVKQLCKILAGQLSFLVEDGILDTVAPLTKVLTTDAYKRETYDDIPFYELTENDKCEDPYLILVPASNKRGFLFFEEWSLAGAEKFQKSGTFNQNIRVVCWYNNKKFSSTDNGDRLKSLILESLYNTREYELNDFISSVRINSYTISDNDDRDVFGRYNFNSRDIKMFEPPYGFFGITLNITYVANYGCISAPTPSDSNC